MFKGTDLVKSQFKRFGIPDVETKFKFKKKDYSYCSDIINGKSYIVVGKNYFNYCVKLAKMLMINDYAHEIFWIQQSCLKNENFPILTNTVFLMNIHKNPSPFKVGLAGSFVSNAVSLGKQVIIGSQSTDKIEEAFPYEVDQIEDQFGIWGC